MIQISVDNYNKTPIYRQLLEQLKDDIAQGKLPPGYKLPTVRDLAASTGISAGTIKHTYDVLEQSGLIKKARGSGSFVSGTKTSVNQASSKAQAVAAIDNLLDKLSILGFSVEESRIFINLKLLEREAELETVAIAVVECAPETVSVVFNQVLKIPNVEVFKYVLSDIPPNLGIFDPPVDLVVTTHSHYDELRSKLHDSQQIVRIASAISTATILELTQVDSNLRLGIACESRRLREMILNTCIQYCKVDQAMKAVLFDDITGYKNLLNDCDVLVLPADWKLVCSGELLKDFRNFENKNTSGAQKRIIEFHFQIEKGSVLYLEDQVKKLAAAKKEKAR